MINYQEPKTGGNFFWLFRGLIRNNDGKTALDYAEDPEIIMLFKEAIQKK